MAKINHAPIDSTFFTVDKDKKLFIAEASDLGGLPLLQRMFDDAADVGFYIQSAKTAKVEGFFHHHDIRDGEDEILVMVFLPTSARLDGWEVHILND